MFLRSLIMACIVASASGFSPSAFVPSGRDAFLAVSSRSIAKQVRESALNVQALFNIVSLPLRKVTPEERESKVLELRKLCGTAPKNGVGATAALREEIQKVCKELAAMNPTKNQARSDLLNGNWELLYTSTGGASAGKLGPFVGDVEQDINVQGGKYFNRVRLGGVVEAVLSAHWDVQGDNKWKVEFDDIKLSVLGLKVIDKEFEKQGRDSTLNALDEAAEGKKSQATRNAGVWEMTYTDKNIRVLYAQGSDPAQPPNVYILSKEGTR